MPRQRLPYRQGRGRERKAARRAPSWRRKRRWRPSKRVPAFAYCSRCGGEHVTSRPLFQVMRLQDGSYALRDQWPSYHSAKCRGRAYSAARRQRRGRSPQRDCLHCGQPLPRRKWEPKRSGREGLRPGRPRLYCNAACRLKAHPARQRELQPAAALPSSAPLQAAVHVEVADGLEREDLQAVDLGDVVTAEDSDV